MLGSKPFRGLGKTVHIKGESANIVDRLEDGNLISYENPISGAVPITYVTPRVGQGFTVLVRQIFRYFSR